MADVSRARRLLLAATSAAIGLAAWIPLAHVLFAPAADAREKTGRALAARHLRLWTEPAAREREIARMRGANAEWDFMARSFLVWSLADVAKRRPEEKARCLEAMDRIIEETLALERERGHLHFLMGYARLEPFRVQPARSLFVDGEVALMIGLRRLVEERPDWKPLLAERARVIEDRMRAGPVLSAESYPDECWLFCNACALAALRVHDKLDGADHRPLFRDWVAVAKKKLVDPRTGILVSSYRLDGTPKDGPEGSSIWFAAHCLRLVDADFARDQYDRARRELARSACGFAWAREWPDSWRGPMDVDSGPVVPIVDASAGSSGCAFVAASSFGDSAYWDGLLASCELAGFPMRQDGELRYAAGNSLGDAVILYSTVLGPTWEEVGAP